MAQLITLEGVKAACRTEYDAGTLLAQSPVYRQISPDYVREIYGYRVINEYGIECHCAIGAALNPETLDKIDELGLGTELIVQLPLELIELRQEEAHDIDIIQHLHDAWLSDVENESYRQEFLHAIDYYH